MSREKTKGKVAAGIFQVSYSKWLDQKKLGNRNRKYIFRNIEIKKTKNTALNDTSEC